MKVILLLLLLITGLKLLGQTEGRAKLYAYKEPVSKGLAPQKLIDENGNETTSQETASFNYLIYLESVGRVYPSEMWINGKAFSVGIETINKTPVVRQNFNTPEAPVSTELVPETKAKVILLKPIPAVEEKLSEKGEALAALNELVVVYKLNGRFYYNTVSKFTVLEIASLQ